MAVLFNCVLLCVWQFNSVLSTGVNLPFTSITYKASPTNPKSLSLFSSYENVESKMRNNFEDPNLKPTKTSRDIQDEDPSTNTLSVSKLLNKLGFITNNDSTLKDLNFMKRKQSVDSNILHQVPSPQPKNDLDLKKYHNELDLHRNLENNKNAVNYNIKVISPPALFSSLPTFAPTTQNADENFQTAKLLSETNKHLKKISSNPLLSNPVRVPAEEIKQESTIPFQNVKKTLSENGINNKLLEPLQEQKNRINFAEHDLQQSQQKVKNEDIILPKDDARFNYDQDITKIPFSIDTLSNNVIDRNSHQIPINPLDTSYMKGHEIIPVMSDVITMGQEITTPITFRRHSNDVSPFNNIKYKQNLEYFLPQDIPYKTPLTCGSNELHSFDVSPTLPKESEIPKAQHTHISDKDTHHYHLGPSLDNIISYMKSNLIFAFSDISNENSLRSPLPLSDLVQPRITKDTPDESDLLEPLTSLPEPNVDILLIETDNATKKTSSKALLPYISSVTISYMPCMESSNDIIIFV